MIKKGYDMRQVDNYIDKLRNEYGTMEENYNKLQANYTSAVEKLDKLEELEKQQGAIAQALLKAEALAAKAEEDVKLIVEKSTAEIKAYESKVLNTAQKQAQQIIAEAQAKAVEIVAKSKTDVVVLTNQATQLREQMTNKYGEIEKILKSFKDGGLTQNGEQKTSDNTTKNTG